MTEFELLLQRATDYILKTEQDFSKLSPTDFEKLVAAALTSVSNYHVAYNEGSLSFPDIVVTVGYESYGIEVKLSKSANWKTIGNSIMESTAKNVTRTYIFFGQLIGSKLSIKFRDYAQCIDDIVVTHSPRYHVDMNIDSTNNLFTQMNSSYDVFRTLDEKHKISELKQYYAVHRNTRSYWWINDTSENTSSSSFVIKYYGDLSTTEKNQLQVQILARFPQIAQPHIVNPRKYIEAVIWLTKKGIVCSNFRDIFSASGRKDIESILQDAPKVVWWIHTLQDQIKTEVNQLTNEEVLQYLFVGADNQMYTPLDNWQLWRTKTIGFLAQHPGISPQLANIIIDS